MSKAKAALEAGICALTDAEQKRRAVPAAASNGQMLRRHSQPLSPQATQRGSQSGLALPAQPLQHSMPAVSAPQYPASAAALGALAAHVSFPMGSESAQPSQNPVADQHGQPLMVGPFANAWRSVGVAQQRHPSFAAQKQRHLQQDPMQSGGASAGSASGSGVARSLSVPDAYWPPGEQGGRFLPQQLSRSSGSDSVNHMGSFAIDAGGGKLAMPPPLGGGLAGNVPHLGQPLPSESGVGGSFQRSAAAELMPDVGSPVASVVEDEHSVKGADLPGSTRNPCVPITTCLSDTHPNANSIPDLDFSPHDSLDQTGSNMSLQTFTLILTLLARRAPDPCGGHPVDPGHTGAGVVAGSSLASSPQRRRPQSRLFGPTRGRHPADCPPLRDGPQQRRPATKPGRCHHGGESPSAAAKPATGGCPAGVSPRCGSQHGR